MIFPTSPHQYLAPTLTYWHFVKCFDVSKSDQSLGSELLCSVNHLMIGSAILQHAACDGRTDGTAVSVSRSA